MAAERKMVRVCVYEDGTYEILPASPNEGTYKTCCQNRKTAVSGLCYYCKEDMKYVYLKRLTKEMQSQIAAKIAQMQVASSNLQKIALEADTREIRRQTHIRDGRPLEEEIS